VDLYIHSPIRLHKHRDNFTNAYAHKLKWSPLSSPNCAEQVGVGVMLFSGGVLFEYIHARYFVLRSVNFVVRTVIGDMLHFGI
jgi:hypothetical protein